MDINNMINDMKACPEYHSMGMIATHLGIVRKTSLKGEVVSGIEVKFKRDMIDNITHEIERLPGIFKVLIDTVEGVLKIGDEIMAVVVGGDIRENVFPALVKAVDRIKNEAVEKREIYEQTREE